jgi:tRNA(adenine34) deaminase
MWETLSPPWQAALEMAWEAYCAGTVPIGAVVADANGNIVSRGRNRITEKNAPKGQVCNNGLAHAEINALLALELSYEECKKSALYTTMEPCPLCMGALYMSDVKTVHFAARDPWAGSTNLLGTTPYLSRKPFKVFELQHIVLEDCLVALHTEYELFNRGEEFLSNRFFDVFRAVHPNAIERGIALHRSGELRQRQKEGLPANLVFNWLGNQVQ